MIRIEVKQEDLVRLVSEAAEAAKVAIERVIASGLPEIMVITHEDKK